jgi:methylenetetrahydrofolate reductase (NADPH)
MDSIRQIFDKKSRTLSFELFPPKTPEGYAKLLEAIGRLSELKPDFFSCTYGAGGGSREKTLDIVRHIEAKHHITAVAHLTCVLHTKQEIKAILTETKRHGIANVLALRGDPPQDKPDWQPGPENFRYSSELVAFIRQHFGDYFGIGVAGFPEGHVLSPSLEFDAQMLKTKLTAGADFVITQLFFENQDYFDYVQRLKNLGVTARVIPGILPITDYAALVRFCQVCGASIPKRVHELFGPIANDPQKTKEAGIDFATEQCRILLTGGAPGLHFYTLNKSTPVDVILGHLRRSAALD